MFTTRLFLLLKKSAFLIMPVMLLSLFTSAQGLNNLDLARQYESTGEFDKAAVYYEKQYNIDPFGTYEPYLKCLKQIKDYKEAEKLIKKQAKRGAGAGKYNVDLGLLYELEGDNEKAKKQFETAIKNLHPDVGDIYAVANSFIMNGKPDLALETFLKGRSLVPDNNFGFDIAELYGRKGETQKMIDEYLDIMTENTMFQANVQSVLQYKLSQDSDSNLANLLRLSLLRKIQREPSQLIYSEFLYWLFMQEKDFESAYIQAKALDKKTGDTGNRIYSLGEICISNQAWTVAEKCFDYIVAKGSNHPLYIRAKIAMLSAAFEKTTDSHYTQTELLALEKQFTEALQELGKNSITAPLMVKHAQLEAFYLDKVAEGRKILEEVIAMPALSPNYIAEVKLELGDIMILDSDLWEASLTYSQVDKDFKHDAIGREAKFRNARLSYYLGEFEWAEAQLSVLKQATSQLISNDALDLALLISDNIGDDSITEPLQIYSRAELLAFQHKNDLALQTLDSILVLYPGRKITANVWFKQAGIYLTKGDFEKAITLYSDIVKNYADGVLADDALFRIGGIYENNLKDTEKAKSTYEQFIDKYPSSVFIAEARRHYRLLRGDKIN
ncbi:MAG: tetratricopeptide repeat protein [Bacteroidia bacterium]|nr:tetratricopeptide repeat protein [Bacteroidia bacterium]MBP7714028.1 tetratricopeptide repeat protein [Bacteroidia bacterium]MBP8667699.1 tetratricopeptide repeat protein [Bacteroidia bacterium]HOZ90827.1 tetratricopeptide repeat protein [Bacteroidia bacterium]HQW17079.1 tetratricopeptide repeat protein [Bacteroidia bacterium]